MPAARSPTGESVISVDNVVKEFGPLRVLDGVGFDVARGQTVAIVGRSGSGKSTLLRCIAGLETVQGGTIDSLRPRGRPAGQRRARPAAARRRHGVPELQSLPASHGRAEHHAGAHPGEEAVQGRGAEARPPRCCAWSG